jgi:CHAT domain-containing protein
MLMARIIFATLMICVLGASGQSAASAQGACRVTPELETGARAMQRAGAEAELGTYIALHASLIPAFSRQCDWPADFTRTAIHGDFSALYSLNRIEAIRVNSDRLLAAFAIGEEHRTARQLLRGYRVLAAIERRDPREFVERLAEYEAELVDRTDPDEIAPRMGWARECVEAGDIYQRCRESELTALYGQFGFGKATDGTSQWQGQCPIDMEPLPLAYLEPDGPLRLIAAPGKALNAACRRETKLAGLAGAWWTAVTKGDRQAVQLGDKLIDELSGLSAEIDAFDSDNPVSRFQPRALEFFVRHTQRRLRIGRRIVMSQQEIREQDADRDAIQPFFEAALPKLLEGNSGFLRVDNVGLAGFVSGRGTWLGKAQGETVWKLLAASFGASVSGRRSLEEVRATLTDDEVLVTAIHSQDGTGVILAAAREGRPWIQELDAGSASNAVMLGAILSDAVAERPDLTTSFPLNAAQILYQKYVCPAELVGAFGSGPLSMGSQAPSRQEASVRFKARKLLFVPDPVMERIPLSLLARPVGGCLAPEWLGDGRRLAPYSTLESVRWISDDYSIRVMPFQSTLLHLVEPERAPSRSYLGIGAPLRSAPLVHRPEEFDIAQSNVATGMRPLAGAKIEFERIAAIEALAGSNILSGLRATEKNVRIELGVTPRFLHFATHGLDPAESTQVGEPLLALTRPSGTYRMDDDGVLTASEISTLSINQSVVVLSACRTASPLNGVGKGIFSGLVQSFFDAGASQAVATYWRIDDEASADLVPKIVERLANGADIADATIEAQRAFRETARVTGHRLWQHPYFWAAFIAVLPNREMVP